MSNESPHHPERRNTRRGQWLSPVPAIHHWALVGGLLCLALWLPYYLCASALESRVPELARHTAEFWDMLLVVGAALTAMGIGFELAYGLGIGRMTRKDEHQGFEDLCGRTRFKRGKKKYRYLPLPPEMGGPDSGS